jgi:hypothetical protein
MATSTTIQCQCCCYQQKLHMNLIVFSWKRGRLSVPYG